MRFTFITIFAIVTNHFYSSSLSPSTSWFFCSSWVIILCNSFSSFSPTHLGALLTTKDKEKENENEKEIKKKKRKKKREKRWYTGQLTLVCNNSSLHHLDCMLQRTNASILHERRKKNNNKRKEKRKWMRYDGKGRIGRREPKKYTLSSELVVKTKRGGAINLTWMGISSVESAFPASSALRMASTPLIPTNA